MKEMVLQKINDKNGQQAKQNIKYERKWSNKNIKDNIGNHGVNIGQSLCRKLNRNKAGVNMKHILSSQNHQYVP